MLPDRKSFNQMIPLKNDYEIELQIKREDTLHPFISGNKYRKLKYNLEAALQQKQQSLLTFGGAFSNHIAAVAYAGKISKLKTIGIIRGEELKEKINPTLKFAKDCGMQLHFVTRSDYKLKDISDFQENLVQKFGNFFLIPEGGTNELAVKGCEEILEETDKSFDLICSCVGTGGTIAGLINSSHPHQKILGFSALNHEKLSLDINTFVYQNNWEILNNFTFGGYAKITDKLLEFINDFKKKYNIKLDPIYTGKMMYGVIQLIKEGYFLPQTKILCIHTGGLQGIAGMNERLKQKNKTLIEI